MTPLAVGLGARAPHLTQIAEEKPQAFNWMEVHPENFMRGQVALAHLTRIRETYPLSLHGVGMSLISAEPLCRTHLGQLKKLIDRFEPVLVSEHLAWSRWNGKFYNDLLPAPMTEEVLAFAIERVKQAQDFLGHKLLIENPSLYGELPDSCIPEPEFLRALVEGTGCGLLLDVNNVFVSANNLGFDPAVWLETFPGEWVEEIHLAGHAVMEFEGKRLCIDDHGSAINDEVWDLAAKVLERFGARPLLIERDKNIPALSELTTEAVVAQKLLDRV